MNFDKIRSDMDQKEHDPLRCEEDNDPEIDRLAPEGPVDDQQRLRVDDVDKDRPGEDDQESTVNTPEPPEEMKVEEQLETGEKELQQFIQKNIELASEERGTTGREYSDDPKLMCRVECSICGSCMPHFSFRRHIYERHNVNIRNYKEAYGEIVFKRKLFHRCKICEEEILFSYDTICDHIKALHELSLQEYKTLHNLFQDQEEKEEQGVAGEEGNQEEEEETFCYNTWLRDFLKLGKDGEKYFSNSLDEGCIYKCKVCDEDVLHWLFQDHLRDEHVLEQEEYIKEYKEHEYTRLSYYKCRICSAEIYLAVDDISKHVLHEHSTSMEDYIAEFDGFEPRFMTQSITSLISREDILAGGGDGELLDPGLEEEKVFTDNLEYSCLYRCRVCRKVVSNLNFEKHLLKKHVMDRIQYKDMYGSLEYTRLVYYRCKVCEASLIFSFEEIGFHVKEHHSLDIQDYEIHYNAFESDDKIGSKLEVRTSSKYSIAEEERIYSSSLDDMCLFKCQVCDKILYHSLLAKHISKVHSSSKLENLGNEIEKQEMPTLQVERLTYYQCKLCPAQIIFTIAGIHSHLKLVHYISIQEYAVKYKGFDPNDSTQPLPKNYQKTSLLQDHLTDGSIRKRLKRGPDNEKYFSDHPDDMCVCKCNFCGKSILHHLLRKHVISKHPRYKDIHGEYEYILKTYYRCKICDSEILFSLEAIKNHVKKSHRLTLTAYKEQYQAFSEDTLDNRVEDLDEESSEPDYQEKLELQSELKALK